MPGSVSDSYDPEWGPLRRAEIDDCLAAVYRRLSGILGGRPPIYVGDLVGMQLPEQLMARLTEKDWRLLRFAVERARESL